MSGLPGAVACCGGSRPSHRLHARLGVPFNQHLISRSRFFDIFLFVYTCACVCVSVCTSGRSAAVFLVLHQRISSV